MSTDLEPLMPGNRFYDPPEDLTHSESLEIGAALRHTLSSNLDGSARTVNSVREMYDDEMGSRVERQELARLRNLWRLHCRFLPEPLPWEFFESIYRKSVEKGEGL